MTGLLRLSHLEAGSRPTGTVVAGRAGRAIGWAAFVSDVEALAAAVAARGAGRWLLVAEDGYAFLVGLIALWQSDSIAVVPPNGQAGTLGELSVGTLGLVTDQSCRLPGISALQPEKVAPPESWVWRRLDEHTPRLELFTSGTTGTCKAVPKTLANLDEEIDGLERHWGARLADRQVFATVSCHHIYGLLFRLLWPVCAGRPFRTETYRHAEELVARIFDAKRSALVTAPVHLRRLRASLEFQKLGSACHPIFSSGGPLDESTADAITEAFGEGPLEIFGSTETGGVAWRQQQPSPHRLAWTPFEKVTVRGSETDHRLIVSSPFVSSAGPVATFIMEDRVQFLPDGRFLLRGRTDRVVKVGEKRVSLPGMEARLREHSCVTEAALTLLDRLPEPRIGAVVVLSNEGQVILAQGRRAMTATLTECLRPYFDPVALPRSWRFVDQLPADQQGKVSAEALRRLFVPAFSPSVTSPEVLDETREGCSCEQTLRVPPRLAYLDGHFPGFPVVPGVVQIQWVMDVARTLVGEEARLAALEALKFKELLRPGQVFHLRVDVAPTRATFDFRLWSARAVFSSGRCRLAPVEAANR